MDQLPLPPDETSPLREVDPSDGPVIVGITAGGLVWRVFRNTASQGFGRILIAITRLIIARMIVAEYGSDTFGEFATIFALLAVAEWILDFGITETTVRELCREPERGRKLMRVVTLAKLLQFPVAYGVLTAALLALAYPTHFVEAGLVGGLSMLFHAGVLIYRVIYKAGLMMEREILAELLSVLLMVPLIGLVADQGWSLTALMGCHVISRAAFFGLSFCFGYKRFKPSIHQVPFKQVRQTIRISAVIGVIGLLVGVYEQIDLVILSQLATKSDAGYYGGAQRLIWPNLIALAAIGGTLYPVVAGYWPDDRERFYGACQRALNTVLIMACLMAAGANAGAEFLVGLIGREMLPAADVLRVLGLMLVFKAITSTMGPVLYVVHAQKHALAFIAVATCAKLILLAPLAWYYGAIGVAWGAVITEAIFASIPCLVLLNRQSGYRVQWKVPIITALIAAISTYLPWLLIESTSPLAQSLPWPLLRSGGPASFVLCVVIFVPAIFLFRVLRWQDVTMLIKRDGK